MLSWLLGRYGKYGTVAVMGLSISLTSLLITLMIEQIFQIGLEAGSFLVSFVLPLLMTPPLLYLEIKTIVQLEEAHRKLEDMAHLDALTGVPNRGHFFELAESYLVNAPPAQPVSLAVMDVDRFKLVNDRYGHLAGDKALRDIAQTAQSYLRPGDIYGRFGGDEFILLCPNTTKTEILRITHRMLHHIQTLSIGESDTKTRMSATIGVTTAIPAMASLPQLIARADQALLNAKQEGGGLVKFK